MKSLVYKVNESIADQSAKEFGLSVIKVEKLYANNWFGIRFESFFDNEVIIEYDNAVKVGDTFEGATDVASGVVPIPKSNSIYYSSTGGAKIWFPWSGRTKVEIKVHKAYKLGSIVHYNEGSPTAGYGRIAIRANLLDMMNISRITIALGADLRMEDKAFDARNFIYFPNLDVLAGAFDFQNSPLWLPKKEGATYDMSYFGVNNYPLKVDNETFSRTFGSLYIENIPYMKSDVTSLSNFKVWELRISLEDVSDLFATLLSPDSVTSPFLNGCSIKLAVSSAITTEIKEKLKSKVNAAGGALYFFENNQWVKYN